jgi:hypothetical protein
MESGRKEKVLAFMGAVPDIPTRGKGKRLSVGRMDLVLWRSSRIILRKASSKRTPFLSFISLKRLSLEGNFDNSGFIVGFLIYYDAS